MPLDLDDPVYREFYVHRRLRYAPLPCHELLQSS